MIIHSTVPHELIFPVEASSFTKQSVVTWNGIPLIVERDEDQFRIVRVLSSNPADYLHADMTPGQYISIND